MFVWVGDNYSTVVESKALCCRDYVYLKKSTSFFSSNAKKVSKHRKYSMIWDCLNMIKLFYIEVVKNEKFLNCDRWKCKCLKLLKYCIKSNFTNGWYFSEHSWLFIFNEKQSWVIRKGLTRVQVKLYIKLKVILC